eukprot:15696465-Heterocapsa_arctica.AAC.1
MNPRTPCERGTFAEGLGVHSRGWSLCDLCVRSRFLIHGGCGPVTDCTGLVGAGPGQRQVCLLYSIVYDQIGAPGLPLGPAPKA